MISPEDLTYTFSAPPFAHGGEWIMESTTIKITLDLILFLLNFEDFQNMGSRMWGLHHHSLVGNVEIGFGRIGRDPGPTGTTFSSFVQAHTGRFSFPSHRVWKLILLRLSRRKWSFTKAEILFGSVLLFHSSAKWMNSSSARGPSNLYSYLNSSNSLLRGRCHFWMVIISFSKLSIRVETFSNFQTIDSREWVSGRIHLRGRTSGWNSKLQSNYATESLHHISWTSTRLSKIRVLRLHFHISLTLKLQKRTTPYQCFWLKTFTEGNVRKRVLQHWLPQCLTKC